MVALVETLPGTNQHHRTVETRNGASGDLENHHFLQTPLD